MEEVRLGVVGMGIGKPNARAVQDNPRGRVVALCDLVQERMDEFARGFPEPVKTYTDYREMCRDGELDAVFVGTPNQLHVPIALEAVRNGKHVLITKPLADHLEPAKELVEAAEKAGVVNMMSLSTRFGPDVQYLRQMAADGEFGELYYGRARSIRRAGIPFWNMGFIEEGGGAFRDMGVHVLDAAWWLIGTPRPVTASGVCGARFGPRGEGYWRYATPKKEIYTQYAADDYAGGIVRFDNGAALQVESFWASHQPGDFQVELFGTEAGARLKPLTVYKTVNGAPQDVSVDVPTGSLSEVRQQAEPPRYLKSWEAIADHFIRCILDGTQCQAPLRHGMIVQAMLEAMLKSGETGREVEVALDD